MDPAQAVFYSFFFGLLHGIVPDEHTWPITFSYAIGGGSGREGMKAGLYFSGAFTVQHALLSETAYLALAPFLLSPTINGIVYAAVGLTMAVAGAVILRRGRYLHLHLLGHHHDDGETMEASSHVFRRRHRKAEGDPAPVPVRWTIVHGFIAGFSFGGFSVFILTVAAPAMGSPWLGFLPGLAFGLGTMVTLAALGALFGASLRWWSRSLREQEIRRIGTRTGGRTLFYGGILFAAFGILALFGMDRRLPVDEHYLLIGLFIAVVAVPSLVYSVREAAAARKRTAAESQ
jgi:sulfite exporter TauE/SafE